MQENEQEYPVNKPPKWLYGIIYGLGIAIVGMIIAIIWGLAFGFGEKKASTNTPMITVPIGKKFADFNIKLKDGQSIKQIEYQNYRIMVYIEGAANTENLLIILNSTNGSEVGRFIIGK